MIQIELEPLTNQVESVTQSLGFDPYRETIAETQSFCDDTGYGQLLVEAEKVNIEDIGYKRYQELGGIINEADYLDALQRAAETTHLEFK
jgi:hypothetical protein